MKKVTSLAIVIIFIISCKYPGESDDKKLKISNNGRYLETSGGKPFLYLGCTAWELFHRSTREEATEYLKNRSEKGFTVIQAVVLAEISGLRTPNAYGDLPLIDMNPEKPNEKYFQHVDFIINKAEELGLYIGVLPTWGDKVPNLNQADGNTIFNAENARIYGEFLGKRYKNKPIIWILGGDRNVDSEHVFIIWKAMAEGLRAGDGGKHLISMHPRGGKSSSEWFHNEDWLDFNIYQSGHSNHFNKVYEFAQHDYLLYPPKPFIDGEPAYEDIPLRFSEFINWKDPLKVPASVLDSNNLVKDKAHFKKGFFTDHDVRIHAYWNLLSGAAGYTYGNNAVWQMFKKGSSIAIPCLYDWRESMNRPGADDIRHIRKLFEARDFSILIPDQSIVFGNNPKDSTHIRAAVASDGSFLIVYLSLGQPVTIVMRKITGERVKARWFNPREGEIIEIGEYENKSFKTFTPPSSGKSNDWVLLIDDLSSSLSIL